MAQGRKVSSVGGAGDAGDTAALDCHGCTTQIKASDLAHLPPCMNRHPCPILLSQPSLAERP